MYVTEAGPLSGHISHASVGDGHVLLQLAPVNFSLLHFDVLMEGQGSHVG